MANLNDFEAMILEDGDFPTEVTESVFEIADSLDNLFYDLSERSPKGEMVLESILNKQQLLMDTLGIAGDVSDYSIDDLVGEVNKFPASKPINDAYGELFDAMYDVAEEYFAQLGGGEKGIVRRWDGTVIKKESC